jgi:hypothetical protein
MDEITRSNIEMAEILGLLDEHKARAGAPLDYKFITSEEMKALKEAGIKYYPRVDIVAGPVFGGWASPHIYSIICAYESMEGYAGMSMSEFIRRVVK